MSNPKEELKRCEWWIITSDTRGYGLRPFFATLSSAMGVLAHLRKGIQDRKRTYKLSLTEKPLNEKEPQHPHFSEDVWSIDRYVKNG